jgi:hypothetical protein
VSGTSKDDLYTAMKQVSLKEKCKVREIPTSLEDVFIHYIETQHIEKI